MKLVLFSDTHGHHESVDLPDGDVLIFAGDMSMNRNDGLSQKFNSWWSSLPHEHKIYIGGNHDWDIYDGYRLDVGTYLEDGDIGIPRVGGTTVVFHGSPTIPIINGGWAWERNPLQRERSWNEIHPGSLDRFGRR